MGEHLFHLTHWRHNCEMGKPLLVVTDDIKGFLGEIINQEHPAFQLNLPNGEDYTLVPIPGTHHRVNRLQRLEHCLTFLEQPCQRLGQFHERVDAIVAAAKDLYTPVEFLLIESKQDLIDLLAFYASKRREYSKSVMRYPLGEKSFLGRDEEESGDE